MSSETPSTSSTDDNLLQTVHDQIIDQIYEIALEPSSLDEFIDFWHDTGLVKQFVENEGTGAPEFDQAYRPHLERAQVFMQRADDARPDYGDYLKPYDNLAAFVVSSASRIEAANSGGWFYFGAKGGSLLSDLSVSSSIRETLFGAIKQVLHGPPSTEKMLRADLQSKQGAMLFRISQLDKRIEDRPAALVVSTQFHWKDTVSELLSDIFLLTKAEQDIVRLLTEGKSIKLISSERRTSEGTVRGQIKSIMGKMNVRGQGDIIRLAMAFSKFPANASDRGATELSTPLFSKGWLQTEVWKPFKSVTLPDHRQLTYHDMGPPTGHPILFSHMGSCMVRWSYSMVKLAFELNLRVICPIRAGYGASDRAAPSADPFETARNDCAYLLDSLRIDRLPYVVQGSDLPLAADMIAHGPDRITELIAVGGQLCLPGGRFMDGAGRWQNFFVAMARNAPNLVQFASRAVMAMSRRIGPEAMLRQLCKDSPADLAIIECEEIRQVLIENLNLMASKATNAAGAFALEYIAFQNDWSPAMQATRRMRVQMFMARQDPTVDLTNLSAFQQAYPWIEFEVLEDAGLALMYQKPERLIPVMAAAARRATDGAS